ncbi:hypothetical protein [Nostoc sp.]
MKKILIIGSGGSGKSTLARELGTILGTWNNYWGIFYFLEVP